MASSEQVLSRNLRGLDNIIIHKGWIPEHFVEGDQEQFRVVHINVDLCQPTFDSLES
jgi:O-methyltransferase